MNKYKDLFIKEYCSTGNFDEIYKALNISLNPSDEVHFNDLSRLIISYFVKKNNSRNFLEFV